MLKVLFLFFVTSSYGSTTLQKSYEAALKQSESLASQEKTSLIAKERYSQARGSVLPTLAANASYTIQDKPSDPLAASFFPRTQPEVKLTLRQPLFRGFSEFRTLRQFSHLDEAEKHAYANASLSLYNDVAQSYHAVLASEENLKNISDQLKLYDERISELTRRVREGTSRDTDLLTMQSSRAAAQAQFENAKANVTAARETYSFLTGLPATEKLAEINHENEKLKSLSEYIKGIEKRPDILDLTERAEAASDEVGAAKGAHAPTIDLLGNYYFKRQSEVYKGIDWDIQAALSFPLFSGGVTVARVSEAALQREKADLDLVRLRRQAEQQVRTLHQDYSTGLESISALEKSLELAEKNYQLMKRDFARGLARNLDVLQALTTSQEVRRELLRARFVAKDKWVQLNIAAGRNPLHE